MQPELGLWDSAIAYVSDFLPEEPITLLVFLMPWERIFIVYLLTALLLALLSYALYQQQADAGLRTPLYRRFLGYVFPGSVYRHPSARMDYYYFLFNMFFMSVVLVPLAFSLDDLAVATTAQLQQWLGEREPMQMTPWVTELLYTVAALLVMDFAVFITHYAFHKVPFLWPFHKLHHSAEVLTPITVYRMHPVDSLTVGIVEMSLGAILVGITHYVYGDNVEEMVIWGVNIGLFVYYMAGYNLRHSHIWLAYPQKISHVLISPAQHQLHHSTAVKHFDTNFGFIFALWDWAFGTLYVPKHKEDITYGLGLGQENPHTNLWQMYALPFKESAQVLLRVPAKISHAIRASLLGLCLLLLSSAAAEAYDPPSVYMEELTWTEVRDAIASGYTTVIIPTGGTEQNGPHMVLGKHNYIIRHTAGEIARQLGKTLVAPVMAYVPEGRIAPVATGHMHFPGTISTPDPVFARVLQHAAMSLASHGFTAICLLGDSGDSMEAQDRAAAFLNRYLEKGRVVNVDSYYDEPGKRTAWLKSEHGWNDAEIGQHAAVRGTSELMAVYREGVRTPIPDGLYQSDYWQTGVDGNPALASAAIGQALLAIKVEAAVTQIGSFRGNASE